MVTLAAVLIGSYLLGSIPFGYLAGRLVGIDIRKAGSGNVGATNVVRVLGKRYGYPVFALDFLKGFGAVKISMLMAPGRPPEWNSPEIFGILAAMSSVLGHLYPPWLKFKGGKGVATSAGALLALTPVRNAHRRCYLDNCVLADPVRFIGFHHSCGRPTDRDSRGQVAGSKQRKTVSLFFRLRRSSYHLASSFKSFAADARHRTALYSKTRIVNTAIIGAGGWGTALAGLWAKDGRKIVLWGHNADRIARMQKTRENSDYLPGLQLPDSVHITSELSDCADADLIVLATPSTALRNIAAHLAKVIGPTHAVLLSCTKGIEHGSGMRMTEILRETFPENKIAVLSGPNLATEVARDLPTATVIACRRRRLRRESTDRVGKPTLSHLHQPGCGLD